MIIVSVVSAVERPLDDADRQLNVTEGGTVVLPCPLYRPSLPVSIDWLDADTYEPITVDQTTAVSGNGTNYWFTSVQVGGGAVGV